MVFNLKKIILKNNLHIISKINPTPFDYHGGSDLYWLIKALITEGINIHLHLYHEEGPHKIDTLTSCLDVKYYKINKGHKGFSFNAPFYISSLADNNLLQNLQKDDYPILFEGLETTYFLSKGYLKNRSSAIRVYRSQKKFIHPLSQLNFKGIKKLYNFLVIFLHGIYERKILEKHLSLAANVSLHEELSKLNTIVQPQLISQFIGMCSPSGSLGIGNFCLFHGDLSDKSTEYAAIWLLENIFSEIEIPFVIAGLNPSKALEEAAHRKMHTCLVSNPTEKELMELIKKAQLNILPSFVNDGNYNSILHSIISGRHILINFSKWSYTEFSNIVNMAKTREDFLNKTKELFEKPFKESDIQIREAYLNNQFNDSSNAKKIIKALY